MEGKVKVCGINFDAAILDQIDKGTQACAIDQQGYQQGFYAVQILNGYVNYGLTIPTREILTGPGVVDSSNIKATLAGAQVPAKVPDRLGSRASKKKPGPITSVRAFFARAGGCRSR